jgi:hypothetical protein
MKYFIVGLHSSGKQEVINMLEDMGVKCGKLFTNMDNIQENVYNKDNYEFYDNEDINEVFENDAYIFIHEHPQSWLSFNTERYYEGLSKYTFDQNDVFVLSPDQLISFNKNATNEEICFIWMDNNKSNRSNRYYAERRLYNFVERDELEKRDLDTFVKTLHSFNNSNLIYFNNEEPSRVATIIYTMLTYPGSVKMFIKNFN